MCDAELQRYGLESKRRYVLLAGALETYVIKNLNRRTYTYYRIYTTARLNIGGILPKAFYLKCLNLLLYKGISLKMPLKVCFLKAKLKNALNNCSF
jgi:hypothetical protein